MPHAAEVFIGLKKLLQPDHATIFPFSTRNAVDAPNKRLSSSKTVA
jgi:hypothetical protein